VITDRDMARQVAESLAEWVGDCDVPGIVRDIIQRHGRCDIDTLDREEYWGIVERHATE
jgi:hypothetical protein